MRYIRFAWVTALVCCMSAAWAQESVTVSDATPANETAAASADDAATDSGVAHQISVDLIDLNRLREAVEGEQGRELLRMTLAECVYMALDNNQDILVLEFDPLKSNADILSARGEFDPIFNVQAAYLRATQQVSAEYRSFSGISSTEVYQTTGSTSVGGKLRWGTMYSAQVDLNQSQTTWNAFAKEWSGGLTLTASQPLLQGRGSAVNLARIRMAKYGEEAAQEQLRLLVMQTVSEVVKAYWDLVGAVESVKVSEEALANADRLLDISKKRFDIGTAAAIEVLQAKAGVAVRQSELISARARQSDAADMLKHLIDLRDSGFLSSKEVIPVDRPQVADLSIDELRQWDNKLDESIALSLERRPEMRLAEIEIDNAGLDVTRTKNGMLPELNVNGSVEQGGRGKLRGDVFTGIRHRDDNSYTIGFTGSMPIGNRTARGAYERALQTERQAEQRREKSKEQLVLNVRLASRAVSTSQILVESNRQARALQETNVVAEEKRLKLGVTTSYRVLQIQQDLTAAQMQELQAQIAYEKAVTELRLAEGTLLDHLGVAFEGPESEKPISFVRSVIPEVKNPVPIVRGWVDKIRGKDGDDDAQVQDDAPQADASPAPTNGQ